MEEWGSARDENVARFANMDHVVCAMKHTGATAMAARTARKACNFRSNTNQIDRPGRQEVPDRKHNNKRAHDSWLALEELPFIEN